MDQNAKTDACKREYFRRHFKLLQETAPNVFNWMTICYLKQDIWRMLAQEREISQKTLQFGFYERGGGAHIFFPLCESVQLISLWGQMWLSVKSLYSGRGSLNVITKEDFVTPFNFNTFSPYNKVDNWRWYMRVNLYRCLSRVYCAWNCWGGGLFERGGLTRELRTLIEGLEDPRGRSSPCES